MGRRIDCDFSNPHRLSCVNDACFAGRYGRQWITGVPDLTALQNNFVLPLLLLSPLIAVVLAMLVYLGLNQIRQRLDIGESLCLCVKDDTALNNEAGMMAMAQSLTSSLSIDTETACANRYLGKVLGFNAQSVVDKLHFVSAGSACFARGLNDTPKIAALLLLVPSLSIEWIIILVATVHGKRRMLLWKRSRASPSPRWKRCFP